MSKVYEYTVENVETGESRTDHTQAMSLRDAGEWVKSAFPKFAASAGNVRVARNGAHATLLLSPVHVVTVVPA